MSNPYNRTGIAKTNNGYASAASLNDDATAPTNTIPIDRASASTLLSMLQNQVAKGASTVGAPTKCSPAMQIFVAGMHPIPRLVGITVGLTASVLMWKSRNKGVAKGGNHKWVASVVTYFVAGTIANSIAALPYASDVTCSPAQ